jgi:hypothetical protein
LLGGRLDELAASIACGVAPQARQTIDEPVPIRINEEGSLTADPHFASRVRGTTVKRVNEMGGVAIE